MLELRAVQSMRQEYEKIAAELTHPALARAEKKYDETETGAHRTRQLYSGVGGGALGAGLGAGAGALAGHTANALGAHVSPATLAQFGALALGGIGALHGMCIGDTLGQPDVEHGKAFEKLYDAERKYAAELTAETRADLPKKDFAVSAKKSNTGDKAYPINDRQHAASALGFAKMHGDAADLAAVRAKIKAKYPDMLKGKEAAEHAEERAHPYASAGGGLMGFGAGAAGGERLIQKLNPHGSTGKLSVPIGAGLLGASLGAGLAHRVADAVHPKHKKAFVEAFSSLGKT